jgi:hypothetical protein
MPKAGRIPAQTRASAIVSPELKEHPLVLLALFSGIGLQVCLIALIIGAPSAWF